MNQRRIRLAAVAITMIGAVFATRPAPAYAAAPFQACDSNEWSCFQNAVNDYPDNGCDENECPFLWGCWKFEDAGGWDYTFEWTCEDNGGYPCSYLPCEGE